MTEIWKAIPEWPEYEASTYGRIKRIKKTMGAKSGACLNPWVSNNGYLTIGLSRNSKVKTMSVHRLIALTFLGNFEGLDVCHYDGNKFNNNLENLRFDTRKGNMSDSVRLGKVAKGEKSGGSKYTQEFVKQLKIELKNGAIKKQLALKYKMPLSTVYGIADGRNWGWL
jgi:hypothetical protein